MILIGIATPYEDKKKDTKATTQTTQTKEPVKPTEALSKLTETTMVKNMGYSSIEELTSSQMPSDSNLAYVNGFEDVSSGTVRMYIQRDITKDEAKQVGILVMGSVGFDIKDLDWIVVRGTDGRDVNISRTDVPALR